MKYLILAALTLSACVTEGPPYDNVRNQRAQESLRDTANNHDSSHRGYYNYDQNNDGYEQGHDQFHRHSD